MSTRRLLLHIGTGKTGTTALQHALREASRQEQLIGAAYPRLMGPNHNFIAALYKPYERLPRRIRAKYSSRSDRPRMIEDIAQFRIKLFDAVKASENLILSAEYLTHFSAIEAAALAEDLTRAGISEARVIAYVREPASYYLSFVQQALKHGDHVPSPFGFRYEFLRALSVWADIYQNPIVRLFPPAQTMGDVVADFLLSATRYFGHEVAIRSPIERQTRNESLSAEAMVFLDRYRSGTLSKLAPCSDDQLLAFLTTVASSEEHTKPRLTEVVRQSVLANHTQDLVCLSHRFAVDSECLSSGGRNDRAVQGTPLQEKDIGLSDILDHFEDRLVEALTAEFLRWYENGCRV